MSSAAGMLGEDTCQEVVVIAMPPGVSAVKRLDQAVSEGGAEDIERTCYTSARLLYSLLMNPSAASPVTPPLRLLPVYTGAASIDEALQDQQGIRLLWLEVLVNDRLDLTPWLERREVQEAYRKACRWYTTYRSLIETLLRRAPLPADSGPVDPREYRLFAEAIRFVATHN